MSVTRRGKFIVFILNSPKVVIAHLKMTGKFITTSKYRPYHRHDRVFFILDDGQKLIFNDLRCFGRLELCDDIDHHNGIGSLGWEPWDTQLTAKKLHQNLIKRESPIKSLLLDQSIIAGIGNIYASEILFDARIDPLKKAKSLKVSECERMIRSMRKILKKALRYNGTTISDYRRVDEKTGSFQNFLKVYGKAGTACFYCKQPISKIKQNQRSTYLCAHCQN